MSAGGLLSFGLRNVNRSFGNLTSGYRISHHGISSALFVGTDGSQSLHLSSLASSKIPDPPKQPMNRFTLYAMQRRQELLKLDPGLRFKDVLKKVAVDWGALSNEEKKLYQERSDIARAEFKASKEKWWRNLTIEQQEEYQYSKEEIRRLKKEKALKKTLHILGKPKRPGSGYSIFISQIDSNLLKPGQKLFNYASETWKTMSDTDKKQFSNMANAGLARYKEELSTWKKALIDSKEELVHHEATVKKSNPKTLDSTGRNKMK